MADYGVRAINFLLVALLPALAKPQDAGELFREGLRLFSAKRPEAAVRAFRSVVELQPDHAQAWKALGVVLASQGDFESAETPFRKACELQPSLPDSCLYYGRTLYLLNRFEPAVQTLTRTLPNTKNSGEAYRLIALSLEALGRSAEAEDAFRQAIRLNQGGSPEENPAIDYAVFLYRQGRAEEGLKIAEGVLTQNSQTARAHLEIGCILLSLDRLPDAATHLERALALDPENGRAHLLLGKTYLRMGKADAAEEHLRQGSRTVR